MKVPLLAILIIVSMPCCKKSSTLFPPLSGKYYCRQMDGLSTMDFLSDSKLIRSTTLQKPDTLSYSFATESTLTLREYNAGEWSLTFAYHRVSRDAFEIAFFDPAGTVFSRFQR